MAKSTLNSPTTEAFAVGPGQQPAVTAVASPQHQPPTAGTYSSVSSLPLQRSRPDTGEFRAPELVDKYPRSRSPRVGQHSIPPELPVGWGPAPTAVTDAPSVSPLPTSPSAFTHQCFLESPPKEMTCPEIRISESVIQGAPKRRGGLCIGVVRS